MTPKQSKKCSSELNMKIFLVFLLYFVSADCPECDYDYTGDELNSDLVVDSLENIDEKYPPWHDPIGLKKPQWMKDREAQWAKDEEDTNEGIVHEEL